MFLSYDVLNSNTKISELHRSFIKLALYKDKFVVLAALN